VTAAFTAVSVAALRHLPKQSPEQTAWYTQLLTAPTVVVGHNDRVVYNGTATQADAERVAQLMQKTGIFEPAEVAVLLHRDASGATLSIPLQANGGAPKKGAPGTKQPEAWDDPAVLNTFRLLGPQLATAAGGPPLTIRIVNSSGELKKQVQVSSAQLLFGQRDRVTYSGSATAEQATALGKALQSAGVFQDRGVQVLLSRNAAGAELSLPISDAALQSEDAIRQLTAFARQVAPLIGGTPVTLRLADNSGAIHREIVIP
jgi:hypothetical protein